MQVQLKSPDLERFIKDQVMAGHFPSPDAAIQAEVEQMKIDHTSSALSDDDLAAIKESDDQIDRVECIDFDTFAAEMRRKYCGK